jgi:acetamidase/formamidase
MVVRVKKKSREDLTFVNNSVLGPYVEPVADVNPGDEVEIETWSALTQVTNPVTGPIYIQGAEPGDSLIIEILDIQLPNKGKVSIIPGFGSLEGWLNLFEAKEKHPTILDGEIIYETDQGGQVYLKADPFVGTIGVSPAYEAINTLTPGRHGGNMDCPDIRPGNRLILPVAVPGALFSLGDVHAIQGDGEICGTAVEVDSLVKLKFYLTKGKTIGWPRIESQLDIMTVGSARPLEDAAREAFRELINWMVSEYYWEKEDAYMFLSLVGKARIAQIVDPLYTVIAKISKSLLDGVST